jgi:hypothetical protein
MTWEWPKVDEKQLAQYVTGESVKWLTLPVNRLDLTKHPEGRRLLLNSIYGELSGKGIQYAPELYYPSDAIQPIRTPAEIFESPKEGTCLDLAALFCGLCLGNELLPLLIVTKGHALAAVSLKYGLRNWNSLSREERSLFEAGPLTDPGKLREWIDSSAYVAIECTGFAQSKSLPETVPEGLGRMGNGLLPFERAVMAGREQLDRPDRPFSYALDVAVAQYYWSIKPIGTEGGVDSKSYTIYAEYRRRFKDALQKELPDSQHDFGLTFAVGGRQSVSVDSLTENTVAATRLILRGYAGGGKSVVLRKCASRLLEEHAIPIIINLKKWALEDSEALDAAFQQKRSVDEKFDLLLRVSITDLNLKMLDSFPAQIPKFIMVDGLNEVYGRNATREILDLLDDYVRQKGPFLYVVVTDRIVPRETGSTEWNTAELHLLKLEDVQKQIGNQKWKRLSDSDKELLRVPYYLDYALNRGSFKLGSAAKAHESFFKDSFFTKNKKFDEAGLNHLAKAAFDAYTEFKSSSFKPEKFRAEIDETIWQKLLDSGVVTLSGNDARFDHQLKHDYLASRYLASHEDTWNSTSFDVVTFESNAFEPLLLAVEQLPNTDEGDKFLKRVYDWNWVATVKCLTIPGRSDQRPFSREIEIVVLAVVAEKLFDRIRPTRERASLQLSELPPDLSQPFANAHGILDVIDLVNAFESSTSWFLEWRGLFTRYDDPPLREEEIRKIASADSILGWTASNVIKRFRLTEADIRQLRAYYDAMNVVPTQHGNAVKWRVVHALGTSDTNQNVDLLFRVLDGDSYHWAKFGAARSLVEIAAISDSPALRQSIVEGLQSRVHRLSRRVLGEIGNAIFYRNAPTSWNDLIVPLLEKVRNAQRDDKDREEFDRVLKKFRQFMEEERGSSNGS